MREQIKISLPQRVGRLIMNDVIKTILVKKDHRDIIIDIVPDENDIVEFNNKNGVTIELLK